MISIALAGKPNSGKSTFFKSATMADVEIANYPFTTIDANHGVTYVRSECPCRELKVQNCVSCKDGVRFTAVELIDVAGLVPDAHLGRGLGNEFLDNLTRAQVIIQVIDASGSTDIEGNPVGIGEHNPVDEIVFLEKEIDMWLFNIMHRNWQRISRKAGAEKISTDRIIAEQLGGVGVTESQVKKARLSLDLPADRPHNWSEEELKKLVTEIRRVNKPIIIAANKVDIAPPGNIEALKKLDQEVIFVSAAAELALNVAKEKKAIEYVSGDEDFKIIGTDLLEAQKKGLETLKRFIKHNHGTGVQSCINKAVFGVLGKIIVYPVEDEGKFTDKKGRVLPDSFIVNRNCTPKELAYSVHTDIGEGFLFGIDAKSKMRIGDKHQLKDRDVIKIVSTK